MNDYLPYKRKSFRHSKKKSSIPKSAVLLCCAASYFSVTWPPAIPKHAAKHLNQNLVVASSGFSENKGLAGVLSLSGSENLVSVVLIEGFSQKKQKNALGV